MHRRNLRWRRTLWSVRQPGALPSREKTNGPLPENPGKDRRICSKIQLRRRGKRNRQRGREKYFAKMPCRKKKVLEISSLINFKTQESDVALLAEGMRVSMDDEDFRKEWLWNNIHFKNSRKIFLPSQNKWVGDCLSTFANGVAGTTQELLGRISEGLKGGE